MRGCLTNQIITKQMDLNLLEKKIQNVLIEICSTFHQKSKTILTESDLKCRLYAAFMDNDDKEEYSVHSEVTHYKRHLSLKKKTYNFRDLSLLSKKAVLENSEAKALWSNHKSLSKGFLHKGPAIHFEIKFVREPQEDGAVVTVPTGDIENLKFYKKDGHERRFIIIWGSRSGSTKTKKMIADFLGAFKGNNNSHKKFMEDETKPLISAYIFDKDELFYGHWDGKEFKFIQLKKK